MATGLAALLHDWSGLLQRRKIAVQLMISTRMFEAAVIPGRVSRVLCLSLYPCGTAPDVRFRAEAYGPFLRERGVQVDYASFFSSEAYTYVRGGGRMSRTKQFVPGLARALKNLVKTRQYDVVWLLREAAPIGPPILEAIISRVLRKPLVYDFDDAIWMAPGNEHPIERLLRWRSKTSSIIRASAHVIAGNAFLADYARNFNENTTIIPTSVDTQRRYGHPRTHGPIEAPVIGWTGSHSTNAYLERIAPILTELRHKEIFRIHIISDRPPACSFPKFSFHAWSAKDEIERLLEFDIGIMPLPNTPWEPGKCGLKIVQYMALGIPPVASGVGVNPEIMRHGIDGFICNTDHEWQQALSTLLHDHELRSEMGRNARTRVEERYSIQAHVEELAAIFHGLGCQRSLSRDTRWTDAEETAPV
jgi:glycosyltransferase involved in cell wall biosynthesis